MYDTLLTDARALKELLDEHPDTPVVFVTKCFCENESPSLIEVESFEVGKIMDDDDLLNDGVAMLSDEELCSMIRDSIETSYEDFPKQYMKEFSEEAKKYRSKWRPVIIVRLNVEP